MAQDNVISWHNLVIRSIHRPEQIEDLYRAMASVLKGMARRLAPRCSDDALQAARVAVWKCLPKVDLARADGAIRQMLVTVAVNAMRDETRRQTRQERIQSAEQEYMETFVDNGSPMSASSFIDALAELRLCNTLKMYAWYIRRHGSFAGAHRAIARRKGLSVSTATEMFHAAAAKWRQRTGLETARKRYADIVAMVLGINYDNIYDKGLFDDN